MAGFFVTTSNNMKRIRKRVTLRVSTAQMQELTKQAKANGLNVSSFVSFTLANKPELKAPNDDDLARYGDFAKGQTVNAYVSAEMVAKLRALATSTNLALSAILRANLFED